MLRVFRIKVDRFESELLLLNISAKVLGLDVYYQNELKAEQTTMPTLEKL